MTDYKDMNNIKQQT